ncbi:MAG TPA: hypothetical protein PKC28_08865 [Bdellovibrionales bacterium]|nr:hypothetical protein [Bdellovibrionales bacterium]
MKVLLPSIQDARWPGLVAIIFVALSTTHCSFKKNIPDHPYPSESRIQKSFFESTDAQGRVHLKTFLGGWMPEMTAGPWAEDIFVGYNHADHVNVVFEIEERFLVGKMVLPSFMSAGQDCLLRDSVQAKQCRARWETVVRIPIQKHYYYEPSKDGRGRQTDVYVENDQRSHWKARPYMNLDLGGIDIKNAFMEVASSRSDIQSVEDIEWDQKSGFLGFTATVTDTLVTAKVRFNFLEFQHDEKFPITPYRYANAKHINILHVIGKQVDGDPENSVLYAAHWATHRKTKHTIWLHGFPSEYEQIGRDAIEEWNNAFEKVGHGRPFEVKISERAHAFDLRAPTIYWVDDRRLSASAPLGVGMAISDVRNGEIKWGQVTVWGGMLEDLINRYTPNAAAEGVVAMAGENPVIQLSLLQPKSLLPSARLAVPEELLGTRTYESVRNQILSQMNYGHQLVKTVQGADDARLMQLAATEKVSESDINPLTQITSTLAHPQNATASDVREDLNQREQVLRRLLTERTKDTQQLLAEKMAEDMVAMTNRLNLTAGQIGTLDKIYTPDYLQRLIKMPTLQESLSRMPVVDKARLDKMIAQGSALSNEEMIAMLQSETAPTRTGRSSFCTERRLFEQANAYAQGIAAGNIDKTSAVRGLVKDLLLHEVGHMLGMGHNFKENILPEPGSVPNVSKAVGLKGDFTLAKLQAQARDGFKNYTTVMGYKDGVMDVIMDYDDLHPGPGDILSLEYLYNQRYPIYPLNAKGEGDFEFAKLTANGEIVENIQKKNGKGQTVQYRPTYFPSCNDWTASVGTDPYCARWDRGYNASTIVKNHFENYRGNLTAQLMAFSDSVKGGNFWSQEYYLWYKSLTTFSRVRSFYDYMRQKYDADIRKLVDSGSEKGLRNLLEFSETCTKMAAKETPENAQLKALFEAKPELADLCVAGGLMINELSQLMQLPGKDYTKVDYFNNYVSGGMTGGDARNSYEKAFGTWKELARIPIKMSAVLTLTSPNAFAFQRGWATPIARYSRADGGYHLSTLYAKQYSSAVAAGAEMNLNLGNSKLDQSTSIGRTILAMGYYLANTWRSNDVLMAGAPFVNNIREQTQFRYSYAIIEVTKEKEEEETTQEIARKFSGTIYNVYSRGPEKVPELYIYTEDRVVMRAPPGSLLMPVSKVRWFNDSTGYFYAIKLDYNDEFFDRLKTNSVRRTLSERSQEVIKQCVQGENRNGLRFFFNRDVPNEVFPGFKFPLTIADIPESKDDFLRSVEEQFSLYYGNTKFKPMPTRAQCEEAIRGQSLIVLSASVLNGYYFLDLQDYLEKEQLW